MSSDNDLVARIVAKQDPQAFGELVQRHQSKVRNFLRKLSGDVTLADDLSQDVFVHAWDKLAGFKGTGTLEGWLMKVSYTTFLQSRRRANRYDEVLEEVSNELQNLSFEQTSDGDLEKFLALLGEDERAAMLMNYSFGMSHAEISSAMAIPVGTVKSLITRSKQKIRQHYNLCPVEEAS